MFKKEIRPCLLAAIIGLLAGPVCAEELRFVVPDTTFDGAEGNRVSFNE